MPSERVRATLLRRAAPGSGKGALGQARALTGTPHLDAEPGPRCGPLGASSHRENPAFTGGRGTSV